MGGPALQLPRSSTSGRCSLWDMQPLGCAIQLLRSSTSGMCNLWDIQRVVPRYSASGICPSGDIQWVSRCSASAIINCWDLPLGYSMGGPAVQLLRSSSSRIQLCFCFLCSPATLACVLQNLFFRCLTTNPECSPGPLGAECTVGFCL